MHNFYRPISSDLKPLYAGTTPIVITSIDRYSKQSILWHDIASSWPVTDATDNSW